MGDLPRGETKPISKPKNVFQVESQVRSVLSEPVGGEPRAVEAQLSKAKTLHNEIISQGRLVDNARDVSMVLVR